MATKPKIEKRGKNFLFAWRNTFLDDEGLSHIAKMTLLTISLYMNRRGFGAWPSIETLARRMSSGVRTVKRGIKEAKEAHYIIVKKKNKGSDWNSNNYIAVYPKKISESDNKTGFLSQTEFAKKLEWLDYIEFINFIPEEDRNKSLPRCEMFGYKKEETGETSVLNIYENIIKEIVFYSNAVDKYGEDINDVWLVNDYGDKKISAIDVRKKIDFMKENGVNINLEFKPEVNPSEYFLNFNIAKMEPQ